MSGWTYAPWRGVFYPKGTAQKRELEYASRQVNSIEINGTFYSLQRPSAFAAWFDATPDNFVFSVKGPRFITHMRRLRDVKTPLANFLASGLLALKQKLGPILWQLPANFGFDADKLKAFFDLLPRDTDAAAKLAQGHDERLKGRALLETDERRPLRYAMEVRSPTFQDPRFIELLREHNVALVIADTADRWGLAEDVTADFVYMRLHGTEELYSSGYTESALDDWASRIKAWHAGKEPPDARRWKPQKARSAKSRDVFVYFDNDVKVKAPFDAISLARRLGSAAQGEAVVGAEKPTDSPKLTRRALSERVRSHWPGASRKQKSRRKSN
jgi:uncharacterized protein YecE (DUF72 family)